MPPHSAGSRCAAALAGWWHSVTRQTAYVLFTVRRAEIEGFARDLEAKGRARATVTRRRAPCRVYKYAVEEELLDHSRPRAKARIIGVRRAPAERKTELTIAAAADGIQFSA